MEPKNRNSIKKQKTIRSEEITTVMLFALSSAVTDCNDTTEHCEKNQFYLAVRDEDKSSHGEPAVDGRLHPLGQPSA